MSQTPFHSVETYRDTFVQGLNRMLQIDQLGTYILVLANAIYDAEIHHVLKSRLDTRYHELVALLTQYLREGRDLDHTSDDLLVFLKLMAMGYDQVQMSKFRQAHPWHIQYNHLRSFRPARMSNEVITEISRPFDEQGFHFNKPFLEKEIMWRGDLHGRDCSLLYNKFPFASLHGLLVVQPQLNRPQLLDQGTHGYLWQLLEQAGDRMPGLGFGYNARGAYASVNHLHFHTYLNNQGLYPIEQPLWSHNGGARDYPLACQRLLDMDAAWVAIAEQHQANHAYNLLYRPGVLYLVPRAMQGSYEDTDNSTAGYAWSEVAGSVTTCRESDFAQITGQQITNELKKLVIR